MKSTSSSLFAALVFTFSMEFAFAVRQQMLDENTKRHIRREEPVHHCAGLTGEAYGACISTFYNTATTTTKNNIRHSRSRSLTKEEGVHSSVASCANVAYGELAKGQETMDIFNQYDGPRFVAPPNPNGPTLVDMGLYITQITHIDIVMDTYSLEGYLDLVWCDPRLAYNHTSIVAGEEYFLEHDAVLAVARIWWPDVTFANEAHARDTENEELEVFPDGTVEYKERFGAIMNSLYHIREFPFDEHTLLIKIESFAWSEEFLNFHVRDEKVGFSTEFEITEWHTTNVTTNLEHVQASFTAIVDWCKESLESPSDGRGRPYTGPILRSRNES